MSDEARHINRPRNDADVNVATSPIRAIASADDLGGAGIVGRAGAM